jgi:hypothetical protein
MRAMTWRTGCPTTVAMGAAAELDDLHVDLILTAHRG